MKKLGKKMQQVERSVEAYGCACDFCYCSSEKFASAGYYTVSSAYGQAS